MASRKELEAKIGEGLRSLWAVETELMDALDLEDDGPTMRKLGEKSQGVWEYTEALERLIGRASKMGKLDK